MITLGVIPRSLETYAESLLLSISRNTDLLSQDQKITMHEYGIYGGIKRIVTCANLFKNPIVEPTEFISSRRAFSSR